MASSRAGSSSVYWEEKQLLGKTIGQYEVQSFLGRGGTATVFRVLDHETGLRRALKITAVEPTDAELHRFKREFRVMSRLAHPNVIAVYRYGVLETRPYFVMELIEGRDLRTYLRSYADTAGYFERVAETLAQVTRALAYIHDRHIIHRDLKPGNILVTHLGLPKVMDFGIAFEVDVTAPPKRAQTLMGTLAYVSPEQATGRKVDARADLYSLGIILYELLSGVKPFTGSTLSQVVYKHLHEKPESPQTHRPSVPDPLSDLSLALLAKRPHERPQSAHEVLVALESFLAGDRAPEIDAAVLELVSDTPPLNEPRFIGRGNLMKTVRARLALDRGAGSGLCIVVGQSGLGKSRMIEEICRDEVLESAWVFSSRCLAQATSPYQGFREIMRAAIRRLVELPTGLKGALSPHQAATLLRAFPDLRELLEDTATEEPPASGPRPEWVNLFTAVRAVLEALTDAAPVVLTFDDLDRADEPTLALLRAVVRTLVAGARPRRLFILATARPETLERGPARLDAPAGARPPESKPCGGNGQLGRLTSILDMLAPREPALILRLEHLSLNETEEMLRSMLGHTDDPEGLSEYLHRQSEGNPYFIEAILRSLVDQGVLSRREHSITGCEWTMHLERIESEAAAAALPAGLQGALRKRLSLLDPRELMILQVAATVGEPFSYSLLQDVTGFGEDELLDFLDRMLKAHLLVERVADGLATYDFSHAKARELISGELPRQEQVFLHQRIGKALAGRKDHALVAVTAHHLYQGRLYDEALPFLIEAGERFVQQQLYRLALKPLAQAEEILSLYRVPLEGRDDSSLKLRIDHGMGTALRGIGQSDEAFEHLTLALSALREQPDNVREADIRTALGHVHRERGEYRKAREHYEEAAKRLRLAGQGHRMGETILGLGAILCRQGLALRAIEVYAEARDLASELQDKPGLAGALFGLGEVALLQGQTQASARRLNDSLQIYRWLEDRPSVVQVLEQIAEVHRIQGQYEEALEVLDEAMLAAREYDLRSKLAGLTAVAGEVYLNLNDPVQAQVLLNEGMSLCARHNYIFHRASLYRVWGDLKEKGAEFSAALEAYRQGVKLAQGISAQVLTARLLVQVARLQLRLGEVAGAGRLIDKSLSDLRRAGATYAYAEAQLVASEVRLSEGQLEPAHAAVNEAVALAEKMEARDLYFRALLSRLELPLGPNAGTRNAGLLRAAGTLFRLVESAGRDAQQRFILRQDIVRFVEAHPAFAPRLESLAEEPEASDQPEESPPHLADEITGPELHTGDLKPLGDGAL